MIRIGFEDDNQNPLFPTIHKTEVDKRKAKKKTPLIDEFETNASKIITDQIEIQKAKIHESGHYSIDIQKLAILFCTVITHDDDEAHACEPNFTRVAGIMGIPIETVRRWWLKRNDIEAMASNIGGFVEEFVTLKMNLLMVKLLDEMNVRDFSRYKDQEFTNLFNVIYNKWRISSGKSTGNISHQHLIKLVPPKLES